MTDPHLCVGPTCWTCGEPTELREMRTAIRDQFFEQCKSVLSADECHKLARTAAEAIREDVIGMMTKIVTLENELYLAKRGPLTRVEIDPNVRVRGRQTFSSLDRVYGPIAVGQQVQVFETEADITGDAWVADIDNDKGLVYLRVMWSSLRERGGSSGRGERR